MKILYAVNGTGNGHITRAMEIIPLLKKKGEVDVLISGMASEIKLPFDVKYKLKGIGFVFGKKGGVDYWKSFVKMNSRNMLREIKQVPVNEYDLIISDFEPVSCWAAIKAKMPSVGLSNQVATLHPLAPKPKRIDVVGKMVLKHFVPTTFNYGYHFKSLDKNIFTPIIRKQVRKQKVSDKGHYTVYLPSHDDERIIKHLKKFKDIKWQVFSKHSKKEYSVKNIHIQPIHNDLFLESMASSSGVICTSSFGTPSEALFLKKKLLVVPMKLQYEQYCNAAMLKSMGVPVMKKFKRKYIFKIKDFLESNEIVEVNYPDITEKILDTIIENHAGKKVAPKFEHSKYSFFQ